jgi:integrase
MTGSPKLLAVYNPTDDIEIEYLHDEWRLEVVGIKTLPYVRTATMRFYHIEPSWLRELTKRFVRFHAATKAHYTLQQYVNAARYLARFIEVSLPALQPEDINRSVMVDFLRYVHQSALNPTAKNKVITHIKLMIMLAGREGWANVTKEKIMYREDRLPIPRNLPRFIPNTVLDQLNKHLDKVPSLTRCAILLLQHTGRRVGEICALKRDCLIKDIDGDYLLKYYEFKMKKEEVIPLNQTVVQAIQEQNTWLNAHEKLSASTYLFPRDNQTPIEPQKIRDALTKLVVDANIKGPDGKHWWFQPHQFRHTVGSK